MDNKINTIIREVPADGNDFSTFFDDDFINGNAGDGNSIMYIVSWERRGQFWGINADAFNEIRQTASDLQEDFLNNLDGSTGYTYKDYMQQTGIKYSPKKCHELKAWAQRADTDRVADIAEYLSITTGKPWIVARARGYCQGDFCEVLYCSDYYAEQDAEMYGQVFCGAAKEFCVIDLDEDGNEIDWCYGFIVADCQIKKWSNAAEEYKKIVCAWDGRREEETALELIENSYTTTHYNYKRAC